LILLAHGRTPNIEQLNLAAAGVRLTAEGAVAVNDKMQTNVPHIYALGDVTDLLNLTPVATGQGHALADSLFGGRERSISLANVPTAVFITPPLGTVGLSEEEASQTRQVDIYLDSFIPMRHRLTGRQRKTVLKLVVDHQTQQVLGLHMSGEEAPEIVQGFAVAVVNALTKQQLDRTVGIHPSAAEEFVTMRTLTRTVGPIKN